MDARLHPATPGPDPSNWQAVRPESDGRATVPVHRAPGPRSASACPRMPRTAV